MTHTSKPRRAREAGFALFTTMIIVLIVGILAVSGFRQNQLVESLSGNSIQRSRALQASEGALITAEHGAASLVENRVYATASGMNSVYVDDSLPDKWWSEETFGGASSVDDSMFVGVIEQPEYVISEVGHFLADGGTGVVNLDRGNAAYGSLTASGREIVLYRFQAKGFGSTDSTKAIAESLYIQTK